MKDKFLSRHESKEWDLVELPKDKKAVGSKWVFKEKIGADGSYTERLKANAISSFSCL